MIHKLPHEQIYFKGIKNDNIFLQSVGFRIYNFIDRVLSIKNSMNYLVLGLVCSV